MQKKADPHKMDSDFGHPEESSDRNSPPEEETSEPPLKRSRGPRRVWHERRMFQSSEEAVNAVQQLRIWSIAGTDTSSAGKRVKYRCNLAPHKVAECPAALYLLYHQGSNCVSLYESDDEHANHVKRRRCGLTFEERTFVRRLVDDGIIEPDQIITVFRHNGMVEPDRSDLIELLETMEFNKNDPTYGQLFNY